MRRERKKRTDMRIKIVFGSATVLILLVAAVVFLYRSLHGDEWKERNEAVATVTASTYMTVVDRVERFVGEKPYMIVIGKDGEGKEAIAWVDGHEIHMEYASSGIREADAREKVLGENPDSDILRVIPGVLDNTLLWEVFYKRDEADGTRFLYDYYRFSDGEKLDTWRLSKRK